jgi:predicted Zn-dependent protease
MSDLKMGRYRRPYFISYLLRYYKVANLTAKAGSLTEDESFQYSIPHAEVRVGSYTNDNTDPSRGIGSHSDNEGWHFGPLTDDPVALRRMFWLLTDRTYKQAVREYLEKSGRRATRQQSRRRLNDFSQEQPAKIIGRDRLAEFNIDMDAWRGLLAEISALFLKESWIEDSLVNLSMRFQRQFFTNSEQSEHVQDNMQLSISMHASTTVPSDGSPLHHGMVMNLGHPSELPTKTKLVEAVGSLVSELAALRKAPVCSPYIGPALLGPDVTGVIFHEAVGHRLEGERLRMEDEGHTFKGKVGKRILPTFIQLEDDPTQEEFNGTRLIGHYLADEQGVPSKPVELVKNGVLKNYLLSRVPVPGFNESNGHGRSDGSTPAQARMGVFKIASSQPKTRDELKAELVKVCKAAKKRIGFIIEKIEDGLTNTHTDDFQAFVERPSRVIKVNVYTGEETLVRGVEIVGTPLSTINKIVAMGDDYQVFNGYCGAESGDIPQTEIAPSCVVSEIELQRVSTENRRLPVLPPPQAKRKSSAPKKAAAKTAPKAAKKATKKTAKKRSTRK